MCYVSQTVNFQRNNVCVTTSALIRGSTKAGARRCVYVPKWLAIPMPDDRNSRHSVSNLERELVKVHIRIEKIALVFAPLFKRKLSPLRLVQEVLLSLTRGGRDTQLFPHVLAIAFCALLVYDHLAFFRLGCVRLLRRLVTYP